jgi:imidazolonepropionase
MLIDEIIPEIAKHELAQYIDVFVNQVTLLLPRQNKLWKGIKFGLHPKIHVNQFNSIEEFNQG